MAVIGIFFINLYVNQVRQWVKCLRSRPEIGFRLLSVAIIGFFWGDLFIKLYVSQVVQWVKYLLSKPEIGGSTPICGYYWIFLGFIYQSICRPSEAMVKVSA